jgi:hypothetical protein
MLAVSPGYGEYNSLTSGFYRSLARELVRTAGDLCAGDICLTTLASEAWESRELLSQVGPSPAFAAAFA